jgi:hypothetical protein
MYQCLQSTNPLTAMALFLVLSLITPISDTIAAETASDMSLEEIVVTA